jgi:hypothetical protein
MDLLDLHGVSGSLVVDWQISNKWYDRVALMQIKCRREIVCDLRCRKVRGTVSEGLMR